MRLSDFKPGHQANRLLQATEHFVTSLLGVLTVATNKDHLVWKCVATNCFISKFEGLELSWDRFNNEPPKLVVGGLCLEDNGSGNYGFTELANAIKNQKQKREARKKAKRTLRSWRKKYS